MSATGLCRNGNWPSIECVECGQHSTMGNFVLPGMLYTLSSSVQSSPQSACLPMVPQLFPFDWAKKCARGTFLLPLFPALFSLFSAPWTHCLGCPDRDGEHCVVITRDWAVFIALYAWVHSHLWTTMTIMRCRCRCPCRWGCWWWCCLRKNLRPVSLMYECACGVGL